MSTYFLPIKINERRYVTFSLNHNSEQRHIFVVQEEKYNREIELLSLRSRETDQVRVTSSEGTSKDINPINFNSCGKDKKGALYCILSEKFSEGVIVNEGLVIRENGKALMYETSGQYKELQIHLTLKYEGVEYKTVIVFHIVPYGTFYKAALDFGSEASQAYLVKSTGTESQDYVKLIEKAKSYLSDYTKYADDNTRAEDFMQYESNSNLLRTMFFEKDGIPLFLSKRSDFESHIRNKFSLTPNLKLALIEEHNENEIHSILAIYGRLILNFLKIIIGSIDERLLDIASTDKPHIGLHLCLLVPNVMKMGLRNELIGIITDWLHFSNLDNYCHLEIIPVSESDASFAGYVENKSDLPRDYDYLTIDAGKGTIDYSVSHLGKSNSIKCFYQGGSVGSGNAITYALFDHVCTIITKELDNQKREQFMRQILFGKETDPKGLYDLEDALENIKRSYTDNDDNEESETRVKELWAYSEKRDSLSASGLSNILNKHIGPLGDRYGIIHATCYKICSTLINRLKERHFQLNPKKKKGKDILVKEVLLTGRAFKFPILRKVLTQLFTEEWGDDVVITFPEGENDIENLKMACLKGAVSDNITINYNCGMQSKPGIALPPMNNSSRSRMCYDFDEPMPIDEKFLYSGLEDVQTKAIIYLNDIEMNKIQPRNNESKGELFFTGNDFICRFNDYIKTLTPNLSKLRDDDSLLLPSKFPLYSEEEQQKIRAFRFPF